VIRLTSRGRVAKRLPVWEGRIGREAMEERERGLTRYIGGWLSGCLFLIGFFVGSSTHIKALAIASVIAVFAFGATVMIWGAICMVRTCKLITDRYGFPRSARRTLTPRTMRDPILFDAWVASEKGKLSMTTHTATRF
jgi:hypothetical protein